MKGGSPHAEGRAEFGSHGKEIYSGSASSLWKGLGFNLSARRRTGDGNRENSDYEGERISAKMTYSGIDRLRADLTGSVEVFELGLPGPVPEAGVAPAYGSEQVTSLFDRQKNFKGYVDLSADANVRKGVDGRLKVYFDRRDMDFFSVYEGFDMVSFTPYRAIEEDEYVMTSLGTNLQVDAQPLSEIRLVLGADANLSDLDAEQVITNDSTGEVTETRWSPADTTVGLYAEAELSLIGALGVTGSARYDWSQAYGSRISPSIGLVYDLDRSARLKLSAGRAFRAPTLNDLYWPESSFAGGNPDVGPEDGFGGELRAEYEPVQSVAVHASGFLREVDDLIEWSPDENWVWRPDNINQFSSRGLEFGLELASMERLRLRSHFTYLSATQKNEEIVSYDQFFTPVYGSVERRAAFRPETEGSITATYDAPFGLEFRAGLNYTGERVSYWQQVDTTGGTWEPVTVEKRLEGRFLARGGVGFHLGPQYFFLRVENIFDDSYSEQFGYALNDRNYPALRRTFTYGLKLTLD
jgi:outer membrane receptor for ferrienterochelin and colicin